MIAIMLAGTSAMIVSLFGTRWLIKFFTAHGQGQPILGKEDHGPEHHMIKQGTPTMGGLAIVAAALIGWLVAHLRRGLAFSDQTMIVWVGVLFMAAMGFLDDYIKVRKRHNRGIFWKQKNYITMFASFALAWWLVAGTGISETISVTRPEVGFEVPTAVWVIWAGLIIWATTNAVNVMFGCRFPSRCISPTCSRAHSTTRTRSATSTIVTWDWSTGTFHLRMYSSHPTGRSSSATSGSPRRPPRLRTPAPARSRANCSTCLPSRPGERTSITDRMSSPSGSCSMRC